VSGISRCRIYLDALRCLGEFSNSNPKFFPSPLILFSSLIPSSLVHIPYREVSIVTRLPRKRGSTPGRVKRYFFKMLRPLLAPLSLSLPQWVSLLRFSPRVKRQGREADNFSPSSTRRVVPYRVPPPFPFMTCAGTTLPNLYTLRLTLRPNKYITFRNNRIYMCPFPSPVIGLFYLFFIYCPPSNSQPVSGAEQSISRQPSPNPNETQ